tara:strand:- start:887 stop:1069 length:183 start_codon:yes stop_codon:yes gene_type:complete
MDKPHVQGVKNMRVEDVWMRTSTGLIVAENPTKNCSLAQKTPNAKKTDVSQKAAAARKAA